MHFRDVYSLWYWNMLSTNYRLQLTDICCRMITTDGEVSLEERIWMHKLCEKNASAKEIAESMLCPDKIPDMEVDNS